MPEASVRTTVRPPCVKGEHRGNTRRRRAPRQRAPEASAGATPKGLGRQAPIRACAAHCHQTGMVACQPHPGDETGCPGPLECSAGLHVRRMGSGGHASAHASGAWGRATHRPSHPAHRAGTHRYTRSAHRVGRALAHTSGTSDEYWPSPLAPVC